MCNEFKEKEKKSLGFKTIILFIIIWNTMPFTFVYRITDISALATARERRYISCSVHKSEWHSIFINNV